MHAGIKLPETPVPNVYKKAEFQLRFHAKHGPLKTVTKNHKKPGTRTNSGHCKRGNNSTQAGEGAKKGADVTKASTALQRQTARQLVRSVPKLATACVAVIAALNVLRSNQLALQPETCLLSTFHASITWSTACAHRAQSRHNHWRNQRTAGVSAGRAKGACCEGHGGSRTRV